MAKWLFSAPPNCSYRSRKLHHRRRQSNARVYWQLPPSEHVPLRSCLFAYHCALICCRIQRLLSTGDESELLSSSTSIFQDMETVEGKTYPLSHKEFTTNNTIVSPHRESHSSQNNSKEDNHLVDIDAQHRGSLMYRTNWRIRLSLHVLQLLQRLSSIEGCGAAQLNFYSQYQFQCIDKLRVLVNRAFAYLGPPPYSIKSPSEPVSHIKNVLLPRTGPVEDVQDFVITEWAISEVSISSFIRCQRKIMVHTIVWFYPN